VWGREYLFYISLSPCCRHPNKKKWPRLGDGGGGAIVLVHLFLFIVWVVIYRQLLTLLLPIGLVLFPLMKQNKEKGKVDVTLSVRKWRCESSNRAEWSFSPFSDAISLCISPFLFFGGGGESRRLARQEVGTERIGKMPTTQSIDAAAWEWPTQKE
jgi:hypothetical protein